MLFTFNRWFDLIGIQHRPRTNTSKDKIFFRNWSPPVCALRPRMFFYCTVMCWRNMWTCSWHVPNGSHQSIPQIDRTYQHGWIWMKSWKVNKPLLLFQGFCCCWFNNLFKDMNVTMDNFPRKIGVEFQEMRETTTQHLYRHPNTSCVWLDPPNKCLKHQT